MLYGIRTQAKTLMTDYRNDAMLYDDDDRIV